ncbi:Aminopeptidase N family protein, contains PDZ domain [Pseudoalteromonas luteoviolacea B = ATCC 29581]|nr:Aminopeptidase N family protein, contains PDZ domain [Pseudoalteromonas luteoviolacea B = ATCC 29581]
MKLLNTGLFVSAMSFTSLSFADVEYTISITEPEHHLANVTVNLPKANLSFVDVKMADWRTGRYEILNLANGVRFFEAKNSQGQSLNWEKVDKNTWRVFLNSPTEVNVSYQVYANELGLRARHIDDSHAFIDASGFFMFSEAFREEPVSVSLHVPKTWRSVSGMESTSKHRFKAANFDVLVDSPIETGINELHTFNVDGIDYELVIWGEGNYDVNLMLSDLKKLVTTGHLIWDDYPFSRYVFMVHATSGAGGATEHLNSTIIQRPRYKFAKREDYLAFISTAAHEFIHTWNVKNYRPDGLVPYDYTNPNYSDLLWLAEGSTSYFEDHLLLSAGISTTKEFFKNLSGTINRHEKTPGREVQSVAATSLDKWINQGGDHGKNYATNIYSEGALVSMALDIKLLDESEGKVSYRDVHRELYRQFKLPKGFNSKDVKAILQQVSGNDYTAWWSNYVEHPAKLNFAQMLEIVGLSYRYPDDANAIASLGVVAKSDGNVLTLSHVARDSSAWHGGLTTDDKIVAIDKKHIRQSIESSLEGFTPGQKVRVDFIRRDKLMSTTLVLGQEMDKDPKVAAIKEPTERQAKLFKAWMGVDHPNAK